MASRSATTAKGEGQEVLTSETLETSRLLLDFLNAAYAARNDADDEDPLGMSSHVMRAAIHIHQQGECSVGQLASGLGISYGWASRVVDELEAARYVVRERDARDHRVVRIRLDPAAAQLVERAYRWRMQDVMEALQPLSETERDAIRGFLRTVTGKLRANLRERPESEPGA
jgi:DNA-binding MarR family transcriptional regulator